jgi:hypothetical protein
MPNLRVDTIKSQDGTTGPTFDGNLEFSGESHFVLPKGTTAQRPTGVAAGSLRFNTDTKLVEQYNGTEWVTLNSYGVGRGVFGGGYSPGSNLNIIDYITIATTGNATDFGDLTEARWIGANAASSSTRGIFAGGNSATNTIDYITIATTGNATDFGDLTLGRRDINGCSSSTRGVFGGGAISNPVYWNTIDYITIATTGNATVFGDLTVPRRNTCSCSSPTRGIFFGGKSPAPGTPFTNIIDYITIATTGNATDFGDLTFNGGYGASCSSSTRGVFAGSSATPIALNTIDYITIASTANSTSFGQLSEPREQHASCSSSIRGVFAGGYNPTLTNTIDYITIATTANFSTDFGELTVTRGLCPALSDAHGGLQ